MKSEDRNIIVICLDSVRKDSFDQYAPRMNKLSDVHFEETRSASSWSVPSHASMITGLLPHEHGVHTYNQDFTDIKSSETLFSDLTDYRKMGVSANLYASDMFGFDKFFDSLKHVRKDKIFQGLDPQEFYSDRYTGKSGFKAYIEYLKESLTDDNKLGSIFNGLSYKFKFLFDDLPLENPLGTGCKKVLDRAKQQIKNTNKPYFQFINLMDAHPPIAPHLELDGSLYEAPSNWSSNKYSFYDINTPEDVKMNKAYIQQYRSLYSAMIDNLDRKVTQYVNMVDSISSQKSSIIITADHGLNLAYPSDRHQIGKKGSMSEGLLHVPMVLINPPPGYSEFEREYFSHLQLPNLIEGFAQNKAPDVFNKQIAAERIGSQGVNNLDPAESQYWGRMIRCVYEGDKKFQWDSMKNYSKFSLPSTDCCSQQEGREYTDELEARIRPIESKMFEEDIISYNNRMNEMSHPEYSDLDDASVRRLKNLGYLD